MAVYPSVCLSVCLSVSVEPMYLPYSPVAISEGQLTSIQIYRGTDPLGISIVGGMDTPLVS